MKQILLLAAFLASAGSALTQGTLQIGNSFAGVFRAPIYGPDPDPTRSISGQSALGTPAGTVMYGGPLLQGTGYTFALFAGPAGASASSLQFVAATTFRTATGNVLPAGLINTITVPIPGVASGQTAALQVRVWDNRGGLLDSWAQVLAGIAMGVDRGESAVFASVPLGGLDPMGGPPIIPPEMTGWTSFNIHHIPEPSVLALGALGLLALVVRRRS